MLTINDQVRCVKGNKKLGFHKNFPYTVKAVVSMGAEYSHQVSVTLSNGRFTKTIYVRHINRLSDPEWNGNNGDGINTARFKKI